MKHPEQSTGLALLLTATDRNNPLTMEGRYMDPATGEQLPNEIDVIAGSCKPDAAQPLDNHGVVIYPNFGNR